MAPSAKNRQPWYFVVIKNEVNDKVADLMMEYIRRNEEKQIKKKINISSGINSTAKVIKQAPILVLIFRPKEDNWIIGDNSSIACVQNMCLRATELGMGSLWIRDIIYVSKKVAKMVNHEDLELDCVISLGIPNVKPNPRPRKDLQDIMEWY